MQVTETLSEGLKRQFQVAISSDNLKQALADEISDVKDKISIKGFRPGKVPEAHIRKVYGRSIMGDIIQKKVQESCDAVVKDNDIRVAKQPDVDFDKKEEGFEAVIKGEADLTFTIDLELLPDFDLIDFSQLELTRLTAPVGDDEIEKSLENIRIRSRTFSPADDKAKAKDGDQVRVDFKGTLNGEPFDGGSAENSMITLGGGGYVPGFEDALVGATKGQTVTADITMPEDYHASDLKGQTVTFSFTIHEVLVPDADKPLDEIAEGLGMENEAKLRETIRDQITKAHDNHSRLKLKRSLFDALDAAYDFDVPPSMLTSEFNQIKSQLQHEKEHEASPEHDEAQASNDAGADETNLEEYEKIAARRIRLGLIMSRVGQTNNISLSEEETNQALFQFVSRYPGQEQQVVAELKNNQALISQITAPALEEKVVDFILELVNVTDEPTDVETLTKPIDD